MTQAEDRVAQLPNDWTIQIGGGIDKNGFKFVVDCRPPIILQKIDGPPLVFTSYMDYHKYIAGLFDYKTS